jgi:signal transduction histidine kinase
LLDDLLNLSVLENAQVTLNLGDARLSDLLDRAITSAGAGALTIDRRSRDEQVILHTDADRLVQVFLNLVSNAAKYCDAADPRLKIRVRVVAGLVQMDFIDNGAGIPERSREIIFEKFSRLEASAAKASGAGLGLAICREIMQRLEGDIQYLPGQSGAAFRVVLPARAAIAA